MDREQKEIREHRKGNGTKGPAGYLILIGVFIIAVVISRYFYLSILRENFDVIAASEGYLEEKRTYNIYIIRDESVYASSVSGNLEVCIPQGERARVGEIVARVVNPELFEAIEPELREKSREYEEKRADALVKIGILESRLAEIDVEASNKRTNDQRRAELERERVKTAASLEELKARLDRESRMLASSVGEIGDAYDRAVETFLLKRPGIISYHIDGWERRLAIDSQESLKNLFDAPTKLGDRKNHADGSRIRAGDPVFKAIDSRYMAVAAAFRKEDGERLAEGKSIWLRFSRFSDDLVKGKVAMLSPLDDGRVAALITLERYLSTFENIREAVAEVVFTVHRGVVIDSSSIVKGEEDNLGVLIFRNSEPYFRPIKVKAIIDGKAVVEGISVGSRVIRNPWLVDWR